MAEGKQEDTQQAIDAPAEANRQEPQAQTTQNEPARGSGSLPLVLSGIAVLLAALALVANQMGHRQPRTDPMALMNTKLGQIEARISDVETQVHNDKLDNANMQLQGILLELRHLSAIADDATRSKIEQAYRLLQPLSEPETRVKAQVDMQSTEAPENQSQPEPAAAPPAESATPSPAPPPTPEKPAEGAAPTAPATGSVAPAETPTPKADSGSTDQTAPPAAAPSDKPEQPAPS